MTINYTTLLGLAQPVTGTEAGTWGTVVNDEITALVEQAVAGGTTINVTAGDVTLTTTNGASNQARNAVLLVTGTPGTSRNIIAPSSSKVYIIKNSSDSSVVLKGAATTGVTLLAGVEALCFWNGSDFEVVSMIGPSSSTDNAVVRFDGTTGKVVQNSGVTVDDSNNVSGVAQLNATTADLTNLEVTNIKAKDGTAAVTIADSTGKITVSTELAVDNLNLSGNTLSSTDSNGNIVLAPNGTGDVQVDADTLRVGDSGAAATITTNGAGNLTISTNEGTNSGTIVINQGVNGNIELTPNGTGDIYLSADTVRVGDSNATATITTNGTGDLVLNTNSGTNAGSITLSNGANGNITIAPNGTGDVYLDADTVRIGDSNANATLTTNGTGDLILNTNSGTNSGSITIQDGVDGNIIIAPNGNGQVQITNVALDLTTLEVTNIKAKDGTAAMTIADTTGNVTVSSELNVDNLNLSGNTISSTNTNGNITLTPNGTGDVVLSADTVQIGDSNATATITTNGTGDLVLNTNSGTNAGSITLANGANGNITIAPNGTGDVYIDADTLRVGDSGVDATIQSNGNADLILKTGNATTGTLTLADGANGNLTLALNGTGQVVFNAGAVGTPSITTTGDPNTGIFFPAADTIAFVEGGVEAMRINSSGFLGIGTTNPGTLLDLNGGLSNMSLRLNNGDNTKSTSIIFATGNVTRQEIIKPSSSSNLQFRSYSTGGASAGYEFYVSNGSTESEAMRIDTGGNVGIGTSSPQNKLQVFLQNSLSASTGYRVAQIGGAGSWGTNAYEELGVGYSGIRSIFTGSSNWALTFATGTSTQFVAGTQAERMRIDSSGNVQIATTTNPLLWFNGTTFGSRVTVEQNGAPADASYIQQGLIRNSNDQEGAYIGLAKSRGTTTGSATVVASGDILGMLSFQGADGTNYVEAARITGVVDGTPGANDMPGRLVFSTTADGAATATERMRIDSSGNVGIGTSSPGYRLDVQSATAIQYLKSTTGTNQVTYIATNTGGDFYFGRDNSAGTYFSSGTGYSSCIYSGGAYPLVFFTNATERARITSAGRLLVGTTTENTSGGILQVSNGITFPATQSASSDANTLDDYEEGTWTPAISAATLGNLSVSYTTQNGTYTKIGNLVTVTALIYTSSFTYTTASGNFQITGLPFTATSTVIQPTGATAYNGYTKANYPVLTTIIVQGESQCRAYSSGSGQTNVQTAITDFPTGGTVALYFTITYRV